MTRATRSGTGTPPATSPPSSPRTCSRAWWRPKASAAAPATSASSPSSATAPPGSGTSPAASSPGPPRSSTCSTPASTCTTSPASWSSCSATSKDALARRPPGGPRLRRHRRHLRRRPRLPPHRRQERRARHGPGLLREQRAPHALQLVPLPRPVRRLRRRRGRLQSGHRPAPQTLRHALDRRRRRRHHHPALPAGQQPRRPDLARTAQPDTSRLTSRTQLNDLDHLQN